jgi:hypothetical protein
MGKGLKFFSLAAFFTCHLLALSICRAQTSGGDEVQARLDTFAREAAITSWPRLDGCQYSASFVGATVGIVLKVSSKGLAESRWDGRCHVPIRHWLTDFPAGLAPGKYIVAATAIKADNDPLPDYVNRRLRILAVFGSATASDTAIQNVIARVCDVSEALRETDRDCDKK